MSAVVTRESGDGGAAGRVPRLLRRRGRRRAGPGGARRRSAGRRCRSPSVPPSSAGRPPSCGNEVEDLALLVTREMGKPLAESRAEVEKCATACDYYAEHAGDFLADEPVATSADRSWIGYEPVGVVLAVMPWNFPLWQVLRFAAPALMAGNAALLKHSPNTTGCALAVQRVLAEAGAPEGLFTALVVAEPDVPAVTRRLIDDPRDRRGDHHRQRAGRPGGRRGRGRRDQEVGARAGRLRPVRRPRRRRPAAGGRHGRPRPVPQRRAELHLAEAAHRRRVGRRGVHPAARRRGRGADRRATPRRRARDVGPMARADLLEGVHRQVEASVAAGARLLAGGHRLARPGTFYAPTVLAGVAPGPARLRRGDLRPGRRR